MICEYSLALKAHILTSYFSPLNDVKALVETSEALESVGSSAYTGAAAFIENKVRA